MDALRRAVSRSWKVITGIVFIVLQVGNGLSEMLDLWLNLEKFLA